LDPCIQRNEIQISPLRDTRKANDVPCSNIGPLSRLLDGNKKFASHFRESDPDLLAKTAKGQAPETLWLGCSDSRVPETTVCDCKPGDIFVHRNIANVITPRDASAAAVVAFSVGVLKVHRIVVCGHTKCGGANASLTDDDLGDALNEWLAPVRELRKKHKGELEKLADTDAKATRLAELNVLSSLEVLKQNNVVQKAMKERGLTLHGVIYDIPKAEVRELEVEEPKSQHSSSHHR
jgi:carbonic anhydrase